MKNVVARALMALVLKLHSHPFQGAWFTMTFRVAQGHFSRIEFKEILALRRRTILTRILYKAAFCIRGT
jgi:tellurite resistance protein TehA-like permease